MFYVEMKLSLNYWWQSKLLVMSCRLRTLQTLSKQYLVSSFSNIRTSQEQNSEDAKTCSSRNKISKMIIHQTAHNFVINLSRVQKISSSSEDKKSSHVANFLIRFLRLSPVCIGMFCLSHNHKYNKRELDSLSLQVLRNHLIIFLL